MSTTDVIMKVSVVRATCQCLCITCCSWIGHSEWVGKVWWRLKCFMDRCKQKQSSQASNKSMRQPLSRRNTEKTNVSAMTNSDEQHNDTMTHVDVIAATEPTQDSVSIHTTNEPCEPLSTQASNPPFVSIDLDSPGK